MSDLKEFKRMKKTEDVPEGYIYVPWIPHATKTFINGIQVWDRRWWKNLLCKINWFLHFKQRKAHKKYANININGVFNISEILEE